MNLSVLIPARNEEFLGLTVKSVLENLRGETEVIIVCDGSKPPPDLPQDERVRVVHNEVSVGQRAATNQAARMSQAKFIMKLDAHCTLSPGFDVILTRDCQYDWTVIPRMYNLHVFNWKCDRCGNETYQGPYPSRCIPCEATAPVNERRTFSKKLVWEPRWSRVTDFTRFDTTLHFQYWGNYKTRPAAQGDIADVLCNLGACWVMHRERYWDLGGLDEAHGSWGQMGVEISCKTWLSGGRQVVNKKAWFSHLFRTQPGFSFPYPLPDGQVQRARQYSRDLWVNGKWPLAKMTLQQLLDKFAPVPGWHDHRMTKSYIYYSDNRPDREILEASIRQTKKAAGDIPGIGVTLRALPAGTFDKQIVLDLQRGPLSMFKQILAGIEESESDIIYLVEHDMLYHPSHFTFVPEQENVFYYNENTWKVDARTGQAVFYYTKQTSGLCAHRGVLLEHYQARVDRVEVEGFNRRMGFEPGCHRAPRGIDNYKASRWMSSQPNIDMRHSKNLTESRWRQEDFRDPKACTGWTMADEIPGWGRTKDRFDEFLKEL